MKVVCVFKDNQDYSRDVTDWLENFYRQTGHKIETMDPDENPSFCEAYDIVEYPTILATTDSGEVLNMWVGQTLPLINEVLFYVIQ